MKQTIYEFIKEDHESHLAHSKQEIINYANRTNDFSTEERLNYFYGISTVFPMMLLNHYNLWKTGEESKEYMNSFVPAQEAKYGPETTALLKTIYAAPDSKELWIAAMSSYISTYPYAILMEYANWAFTEDEIAKTSKFIAEDRATTIPELIKRIATCYDNEENRINTILYLGTDFPFELLHRFHTSIF